MCVTVGRETPHCCFSPQKAIPQNLPHSSMPSSNATFCQKSPLPSSQPPHTSSLWRGTGTPRGAAVCQASATPPTPGGLPMFPQLSYLHSPPAWHEPQVHS